MLRQIHGIITRIGRVWQQPMGKQLFRIQEVVIARRLRRGNLVDSKGASVGLPAPVTRLPRCARNDNSDFEKALSRHPVNATRELMSAGFPRRRPSFPPACPVCHREQRSDVAISLLKEAPLPSRDCRAALAIQFRRNWVRMSHRFRLTISAMLPENCCAESHTRKRMLGAFPASLFLFASTFTPLAEDPRHAREAVDFR